MSVPYARFDLSTKGKLMRENLLDLLEALISYNKSDTIIANSLRDAELISFLEGKMATYELIHSFVLNYPSED
jgi:hypothetical protein